MNAFSSPVSADDIAATLERLRSRTPRVHCITNAVAQTFTANVLLALGAVPSMTVAPDEVEGFAKSADALLVNLGTLDRERRHAIPQAMAAASLAGRPIVLDPVFVNRSEVRCAYARDLLAERPTLLRANQPEIESLLPGPDPTGSLAAKGIALAMTGPEDLVWAGDREVRLGNGDPLLARVTATGCAGGAVMAAFLAVEPDPLHAAAAALSVFNIAGEIAAENARGPGTLVPELLDTLYGLEPKQIAGRLKLTGVKED
ncbi:hydroxyethylthiazole kinase [Roseibium sp.]|uniref:hydroxyethylthiazole kinase n=1 Tax=Roseibium sp. TaxID=1936156 RepID=UPI003A97F49E